MRKALQFAAFFFLAGATATHAQITNPNILVAPSPPNPAHRSLKSTEDNLQWLWQFSKPAPNGDANALRTDPRFQSLLTSFKQPQAMWGPPELHEPLAAVIPLFLSEHGIVTAEHNRYLTVDGCVPSFCPAHGLLWVDLGTPHPLMVFAAINWTTQNHPTDEAADYNLWLFPSRPLVADELPLALTEALSHWDARLAAAHRLVPHIAHAVLIQPDGTPQPLDPQLAGANTLAPQPDTTATTKEDE